MRICWTCAGSSVSLDPEPMSASMASMWVTGLSWFVVLGRCWAAALDSAGLLAAGSGAGLLGEAVGDALLDAALLDIGLDIGLEDEDDEAAGALDELDELIADGAEAEDAAGALGASDVAVPAAFSKSFRCERNSTSLPLIAGSSAAAVLPDVPTAPGVPVGAAEAWAGAPSAPMSAVTLASTLSYEARQSDFAVIS